MHDIKQRIKGIKQTRQITRAMKLISAVKLKKARLQLEGTRPYFNKVKSTIADILIHSANVECCFFEWGNGKKSGKSGYVVISGDKGFTGGYNSNLIKFAERKIKNDPDSLLLIAGNTGRSYFSRKNVKVHNKFNYPVENPTVSKAVNMTQTILEMFKKEELREVFLIFTRMVSTIKLEVQVMKLLPLDLESLTGMAGEVNGFDEGIVYEPSPAAVLNAIIPIYVEGVIYGALVEAFTCEQCARMTAMDNATSNADEMLQNLNLFYNRARQAAITREISEITGGAAELL